MKKVESSQIAEMGLEGTTMHVKFHSGVTYEYLNVERELFHEIVTSESVGSAFNKLIKKNAVAYPYRKL